MIGRSVKASTIVTKTVEQTTAALLDTDIATFVHGLKEEQLVTILFQVTSTPKYVAMIVYTQ